MDAMNSNTGNTKVWSVKMKLKVAHYDVYFSIRHELCIYPVLLVGVMGNSRLGIESGHGTDIPILYRRK